VEKPLRERPENQRSTGTIDTVARCAAVLGIAFPLLLIVVFQKLGMTAFLGFAFLGITAIQLTLHPTLPEIILTGAAGATYYAVYRIFGGAFPLDPVFRAIGIISFVGVGSLLAMVARALWSDGGEQQRRVRGLLVGVTPIVFLAWMPAVFRIFNVADPWSYDRWLYAFDSRFGFQISFAAGRIFEHWPWLQMICALVYLGLPLAMACVYLVAPHVPDEPGLIRTFLLTGVLGGLLFHFLPAAGPVYAYTANWPGDPPAIVAGFLAPLHLSGVRLNAIPSLHTAWGLLIFWRTRRNDVLVRVAAGLFLLFTLLATLGLGEHYVIDLVVAVPFVVGVRALCMTTAGLRSRLAVFCFTATTVGLWLSALRSGVLLHIPVVTAWGLAVVTIASALWLDVGMGRYRLRLARKRLFVGPASFTPRFGQGPWCSRRRRQWAGVL